MTEVSIVIPVRNGQDFIRRSIESALHQTLDAIEVIVIDDASTDNTTQIVADYEAGSSKIKLIRFPTNRGPSAARNAGISAATGRWIALLDADDWYAPNRLEYVTRAGNGVEADLVCDDLLLFDEAGGATIGPMFGTGGLPPSIDGEAFVLGNMPNPHQPRCGYGFLKPIVRKAFLVEKGIHYNEEMRFAEDYAFYVDALLAGGRWITVPEATYIYSVRDGSLTFDHRAADLFKLCAVDQAAWLRARGNQRLQKALRRHFISTQERAAWVQFIDCFKERRPVDLIQTATMSMPVLLYITKQCFNEAVLRSTRRVGLRRNK
ncbi:glycosyltransferase [Microvirga terrae]|uniref:Glycosyltransferase n=1 Tax=Microvirga terrae TaxID=2740529 RepID=A0ABY5RMF4_9HYPH|nr:glycosyltransferase family 2 protein [Microvirga terrae]UVF18415.1 glycosyltransferase [Microvirga terrae]